MLAGRRRRLRRIKQPLVAPISGTIDVQHGLIQCPSSSVRGVSRVRCVEIPYTREVAGVKDVINCF